MTGPWADPVWPGTVAAGLVGLAVALSMAPSRGRFLRDRFGSGSADGPGRTTTGPSAVRPARSSLLRRMRRSVPGIRRATNQDDMTREASTVLGAELRAGRSAEAALAAAATVSPSLEPAARAARAGGDAPAALGVLGPGGRALALAWAVGERSGIGLAALVDRVADGVADDQEIRREVEAQLAGPRATARMLAGLPLLGLLLGAGFGDPLGFLLGSGYGIACLAASALLAVLGLCWVERLARRARA